MLVSDFIDPTSTFEVMNIDSENKVFFVDGNPAFIEFKQEIFPTLFNVKVLSQLPYLIVDMGAVSHVCNGADILAPGITKISGNINIGSFVVILEEKFSKKIAIAKALLSSSEMVSKKQGKVAENIHYVSDKFWNMIKEENII